MIIDTDTLTRLWGEKWPECPPGWWDRQYPDRWVRFHSLPKSKRYPETAEEVATMLNRHYILLQELNPGDSLLIVTTEWTSAPEDTAQSMSKRAQVDPEAIHWRTTLEDPEEKDPEFRSYRQTYVSSRLWQTGVIDELLRAVADNEVSGVILAPQDLRWLYHPYDGGADIILPSKDERDTIKALHKDWLSSDANGL